jgi:hypothetical protein
MKCYNVTLLLTLLFPNVVQAETKADFQFCRERTLVIFNLYTKVENGLDVELLYSDALAKQYPLEAEIVKNWWQENLGDKVDLVKWHQSSCMKARKGIKDKVMV